MIEADTQLAGREDPDVAAALLGLFHDGGVNVLLGTAIPRADGLSGDKVSLHVKDINGDRVHRVPLVESSKLRMLNS